MSDNNQEIGIQEKSIIEPKVSIIVPAYNTEKYLPKCLESLINQTLKEIEIILVNDGSTDNTLAIANAFAQKDSRIKVITQDNKKQGAARNQGMRVAQGEYVAFIDSDDWVDLDFFEKLYLAAKKYSSDLALATNVRIGNGKTKKRLDIEKEEFVTSLQDKIDVSHQVKNPCPTNKIYSRKMLFDNEIFWPENVYCEDKLFTIQAIYYANGLVTVPDVYYYYFRNPESTVNSKAKKKLLCACKDKDNAKRAVLDFLKTKKADIRDKEFWAIKKSLAFNNMKIFVLEESLESERISLFGVRLFTYKK